MYSGHQIEYVLQLLCALPYLEKTYPGLDFFIACNFPINHHQIVSLNSFSRKEYGQVYGMISDGKRHPVVNFLTGIKIGPAKVPNFEMTNTYKVASQASPPIKSLTESQRTRLVSYAESQGFKASDNASWVLGPENEATYMAAIGGHRVTMLSNGISDKLFITFFPQCEILNI